MQKIKKFFKTKTGIAIIGLVIIMLIYVIFFRGGKTESTDIVVKKTDFEKVVSISGKVIPAQSVDLAFETSGTVARVYKDVGQKVNKGDVIASLDASDAVAQRDIARADLLTAEAELAKITNSGVNSDVGINKEQVVNSIVDAYTRADDAVHNKVDQFFDEARTTGPKIKYTFYDYFATKDKINDARAKIEITLETFGRMANSLTVNSYTDDDLDKAKTYVQKVKTFLDIVAPAANSFEESYSLSASTIAGYRESVAKARTDINASLAELTSYQDKLHGSLSDASIQKAKVQAKEANVRSYDAQIAKTVIVAPFSGLISFQDAKAGESVSQNTKMTSMISSGYQIEAYIPEINISGISVGNTAKVTLDAYGDEEFSATIIHIDPAETVRDGVSNYKVKLAFDKADPRILSGMTADVNIVTEKIPDTIVIPERITTKEGDAAFVTKIVGDKTEKVQITLGRKDGKGNIEVTSGLTVGDKLVLNP